MDVEACLALVEAALIDGDANLMTDLGNQREQTQARLWRGQVLVDWEPDVQAGGCLLRPDLLRRLIALHAQAACDGQVLTVHAPGHIVAGLSPERADLVRRLGGARRVEMTASLVFADGSYRGGEEVYYLRERGRRVPLVRLRADVHLRSAGAESPRTSPVTT
ncbi:MAG TPA: hypothetical protein VF937_18275 [Chloroflexota bacterium]